MSAQKRLEEQRRRQKEMAAEDAATEKRLQEEREAMERQQREEQKKMDEERKCREAEEKARRDEQEEATKRRSTDSGDPAVGASATNDKTAEATTKETTMQADEDRMDMDSGDEQDTNEHLRGMQAPGDEDEEFGESSNPVFESKEDGNKLNLPVRKKKKKDKSKKKQKEEREAEQPASVESVLRHGKYTSGAAESKKKKKKDEARERAENAKEAAKERAREEEAKKKERKVHKHVHGRNVVECSYVCCKEEMQQRYDELPAAIKLLLKNMQKVDKFVCLEPVEEGEGEKVQDPSMVPFDHTDLGSYVVQSGGLNAFAMKKSKKWGRQKVDASKDEEGLVMPEIYFYRY